MLHLDPGASLLEQIAPFYSFGVAKNKGEPVLAIGFKPRWALFFTALVGKV